MQRNYAEIYTLVAKTDSTDERFWLPLSIHLQDTMAVMEYLSNHWLPNCFCNCLGMGREDFLTLAKAAALFHDVGKSTKIFQWSITKKLPELRERLLHTGLNAEFSLNEQPTKSIPHAAAGAELLRWQLNEEGASEEAEDSSLAAIIGAHHGKTECSAINSLLDEYPKEFGWAGNGSPNTSWGAVQKALICWAEEQMSISSLMQLPTCSMVAQMALAGLVIMADWIASNTAYFPLISIDDAPNCYDKTRAKQALQKLCLPEPWVISDDWKTEDYFKRRFAFKANIVQETAERIAAQMETPGVMILEAPMGHGKTEAALSAAEILMNRFHLGGAAFFLPSQATSNAMFTRMMQWAQHQPDAVRVAVELIHGQAAFNADFAALEKGNVRVEEDEPIVADSLTVHSFFRGRKTGLLANLVVGTVDQLLMAALQQKHVMLRQLGLTGKVVIIDECHAYDAYMNVYLDRVLNWLGAYHVPVILLSATLPGKRRAQLLRAYLGEIKKGGKAAETAQEYPLLSWTQGNDICMEAIPAQGQSHCVAIQKTEEESALDEAGRMLEHGCVGVIVNTVKRAQSLREKLKKRYPNAGILMDHSQFLAPDRLEHEQEILQRVGKHSDDETRKGVLVIGTQVLEQSLDLDFDLLITDLCPMDLLLQRIGRLHRHERTRPTEAAEARCLVLNAEGELDGGSCAVYGAYLLLRTREFLPDVIRLPEDISPLVQKTYDEIVLPQQTDAQYETARQQYQKEQKDKKNKAKGFLLQKPERNPDDAFASKTIVNLMNGGMPGFTDLQARAAVRDGTASIEVLVVQRAEEGLAKLLSGEKKGMEVRTDTQPSREEARAIAMQRLRLPARFSQAYCIDSVIDELETATRNSLMEWTFAPMLQGEVFLILERNGTTTLNGKTLRYDSQVGLLQEENEHGAN